MSCFGILSNIYVTSKSRICPILEQDGFYASLYIQNQMSFMHLSTKKNLKNCLSGRTVEASRQVDVRCTYFRYAVVQGYSQLDCSSCHRKIFYFLFFLNNCFYYQHTPLCSNQLTMTTISSSKHAASAMNMERSIRALPIWP